MFFLSAGIQSSQCSPGAGGKETGTFAEHSSSVTSRLIQDERRLHPLWKIWGEADAHAAETSLWSPAGKIQRVKSQFLKTWLIFEKPHRKKGEPFESEKMINFFVSYRLGKAIPHLDEWGDWNEHCSIHFRQRVLKSSHNASASQDVEWIFPKQLGLLDFSTKQGSAAQLKQHSTKLRLKPKRD